MRVLPNYWLWRTHAVSLQTSTLGFLPLLLVTVVRGAAPAALGGYNNQGYPMLLPLQRITLFLSGRVRVTRLHALLCYKCGATSDRGDRPSSCCPTALWCCSGVRRGAMCIRAPDGTVLLGERLTGGFAGVT